MKIIDLHWNFHAFWDLCFVCIFFSKNLMQKIDLHTKIHTKLLNKCWMQLQMIWVFAILYGFLCADVYFSMKKMKYFHFFEKSWHSERGPKCDDVSISKLFKKQKDFNQNWWSGGPKMTSRTRVAFILFYCVSYWSI